MLSRIDSNRARLLSNGKRRGTSAPTGSARGALTLRAMATLGKCTACKEDALADAHGHPFLHPKLGVLLCERCHGRGRG